MGPKLAQRITLELKDKVKDFSGTSGWGEDLVQAGGVSASGNASQAVSALTTLGYSPSEAAAAVGKLDSSLPPEELIRPVFVISAIVDALDHHKEEVKLSIQ